MEKWKGWMKRTRKAVLVLATLLMSWDLTGITARAGQSVPYVTYTYDYYKDVKYTPAAYVPDGIVTGAGIGCGNLASPQDLNTDVNGDVYIADTNNNRIVVADRDFNLLKVIEEFDNNGKADTFSAPNGVYISSRGNLYIADTGNMRVVELDSEGKLVQIIADPKSDILDDDYVFKPIKVAVDYADRIYVIAQNQFEGIMAFEDTGEFTGFTGTIQVKTSPWKLFWRRFSTKEQRARQQLFIPTEFTGMEINRDGFIYATNVDAEGLQSVRKLNPSGEDVIQMDPDRGLSGDLEWKLDGTYSGPSRIVDVAVRDQGIYSLLDSLRGRIFTYDHEGNLLYIFGGLGSQEGTFTNPVAIDTIDGEILVLDAARNLINRFKATQYGSLIDQAVGLRFDGDEVQAVECWKEVLKLDSNFELAYVGIGKSCLAAGENREAMDYFRTGNSKQYYGIAYKRYRNEILKKNMNTILTGIVVLFILWTFWSRVGKRLWKERRESHV